MLKKYDLPFKKSALFICTKCSAKPDQPGMAESLKTELRTELKALQLATECRVMTSGCLGLCAVNEQTFAYFPNQAESQIFTTSLNEVEAKQIILEFIKKQN